MIRSDTHTHTSAVVHRTARASTPALTTLATILRNTFLAASAALAHALPNDAIANVISGTAFVAHSQGPAIATLGNNIDAASLAPVGQSPAPDAICQSSNDVVIHS